MSRLEQVRFGPEVKDVGVDLPYFDHFDAGNGLLQCDALRAHLGGRFVQSVVDAALTAHGKIHDDYQVVVDSKIHMLKPGWYPGIPGWHLDFVPGWDCRGAMRLNDADTLETHYMAINSAVSATEFLNDHVGLNIPRGAENVNGILSRQMESMQGLFATLVVAPCRLYRFTQLALHRVMPATSAGWRIFVRVSITKLRGVERNPIRRQGSQVYIADTNAGW